MPRREEVAGVLKRFLFLYAFGLVLALQAASLMEYLGSFSIHWPIRIFSVGVMFPLLFVYLGRRFFPVPPPKLSLREWGLNALLMFGFWAGGYFVVGSLSYSGEFYSMAIPLDGMIPFRPEWVFVYLTVYGLFLIPLFYIDKKEDLLILDASQAIALTISYTMFVIYPVAIERPPILPSNFAAWALSMVQAKDPPWNCFPSTHCTTCTVAALALVRANPKFGWWAIPSTLPICVSTVMTKQHFVLDALAGVILGTGIHILVHHAVRRTQWGRKAASRLVGSSRPLNSEV